MMPHRMNGQLSHQPLAQLIREISAKSQSGSLRVEQARIKIAPTLTMVGNRAGCLKSGTDRTVTTQARTGTPTSARRWRGSTAAGSVGSRCMTGCDPSW